MKRKRFSKEIKEQIINRIKNDGVSVKQASEDHGVSTVTIYSWLGTSTKNSVSLLTHNKLKKENEQLRKLIGDMVVQLSKDQKKTLPWRTSRS